MKYYGPFYKNEDGQEIWHWHKQCPDFPDTPNPETMISSSVPKQEILCQNCLELDSNNPSPFAFYDAEKKS